MTQWHELQQPPALPPLYLRAALRRGIRGKALPERGLRCELSVDPAALARYRAICGYPESHYLPPCYPHVLAFALQMQLLTANDFPFPLLGLVHLENSIRVLRPLGGLGPFQLSLHAEGLAPHDKGATFSLITRLEDALGLLWEGDSRLLCRGVRLPGEAPPRETLVDGELHERDRWKAPADIGRRYARVSGDYNPIHLSAISAKAFGFPRAIAHGLWVKSRALAALGESLPSAGYAVQVQFKKPLLLPGEARLLVDGGNGFTVQGSEETPHLSGRWQTLG